MDSFTGYERIPVWLLSPKEEAALADLMVQCEGGLNYSLWKRGKTLLVRFWRSTTAQWCNATWNRTKGRWTLKEHSMSSSKKN